MALRMTHETLGEASCATEAQFHALHEANGWVLVEVTAPIPDPTPDEQAVARAAVLGINVAETPEPTPEPDPEPPAARRPRTPAPKGDHVSSEED